MKYKYKPLLRELRSSFKSRSREYFLENNLHGVPYFVDSTRPKWERITWFLLTALSIVAIVAIIATFLYKFQTEPTITGLDIITEHIGIEFPQIFICFDWSHLNHSHIREPSDSNLIPGERPAIRMYFPVDIEFIVEITYTTSDIRYLLLRQRKCYYNQEGISLNDCEINCLRDKLFAHCECLPWFLSFADKTECTVSKYSCLNNVNIDMTHCNCWLSCDHTSYSIKGVKKSLKDVTRIMLRNWPTALYRREMRFGYLDLLVSFGGIASLFLGFSLLSSIEFGYYFTLRTYCGAVVQSSRKQYNIVTVHVVEKLPNKVDTNLKYYQYID
ncbi:Sodium channel protein Nach [Anthophora quadrimaculata]